MKKNPIFIHLPVDADEESESAHAKRQFAALADMPYMGEKLLELKKGDMSLAKVSKFYIEGVQKAREAGLLSMEYAAHVIFFYALRLAEEEINKSEKMKEIVSKRENLRGYDDWINDKNEEKGPPEGLDALIIEEDQERLKTIAEIFKGYGEIVLAHLLVNDSDEFFRITKKGSKESNKYER